MLSARLAILVAPEMSAASGRSGNILKCVKDFYLKTKAEIWPCFSHMCHLRAAAFLNYEAG